MMRYVKILFLAMVVIGLLMGVSNAAILYNSQDETFGTGTNTGTSYKIAYEIYSETAGVSTVAASGVIRIDLSQPLYIGETANLVATNANFNSAGANFKWILLRGTDSLVIGITPSAGLTTNNIPFSIVQDASIGNSLYVQQVENWVDDGNWVLEGGEFDSLVGGAGMYVLPGLNATCTSFPLIKVDFTTPHETTPAPINFAYITPQFSGGAVATNTLTAELDTDYDFMQFIYPSGPYVQNPWEIYNGNFIVITDGYDSDPAMWIAYADADPDGTISFDLVSLIGEPDASIELNGNLCDPDSDSKVFECLYSGDLVEDHDLFLWVDGTSINEPTNWSLENFSIQVTTAGLKNLCVTLPPGGIGVWYGGLEAFVPFVKGTVDRSYETYIKLFNRYDKNAKVYVSTFADVPGGSAVPIMIATGQITGKEEIPAGDVLSIDDTDIGSFLTAQGISWDMSKGLPVKFSIRVPSQIGTTTSTSSFWGWDYGWIWGWDESITTHQNPNDPYVEGIVVSIVPGGGQRSIPLKFKTFKNGEYGH